VNSGLIERLKSASNAEWTPIYDEAANEITRLNVALLKVTNDVERLRSELAGSLAKNTEWQEKCYCYADKVAAMRDELLALEKRLVWEENRATRIGTHGTGCERWGPRHYECLLRKYDDVTGRPLPHFQD
jgi:hypothetical protein